MRVQTDECKSCGRPIFWAKTTKGKPMPIDREPDPAGNLIVMDGTALVVAPLAYPTRLHWRPHFATCPQAEWWRHVE